MPVGPAAQVVSEPRVSVVMSVYNGASSLRKSIESILSQEGVELEFVVIDDGSTDCSGAIVDELADRDSRIRVVHQSNTGLTRALIRGCAMATGTYIARQDCGDLSLPGRLLAEVQLMEAHPKAALVSCGTRILGPKGESLYDVLIPEEEATSKLLADDPDVLRGPWHGSVLFRRDVYERSGGYRREFYFAQDLDLWTRLVEHGTHQVSPSILYQASFTLGSISSLQRRNQLACKRLIVECARLRRAGMDEANTLAQACAISMDRRKSQSHDVAAASYFVGMCLRNRGDPRSRQYFWDALRANPVHVKAVVRLLLR